jgi:hypothetical protein
MDLHTPSSLPLNVWPPLQKQSQESNPSPLLDGVAGFMSNLSGRKKGT